MDLHLKIVGYLLIVLGLGHAVFPRYFNWKEELRSLSMINRQMMVIHTFFIALTLVLMGIFCVTSSTEIVSTNLGRRISLGFGLFWVCRLLIQFFGYSSSLWRGKKLETAAHIAFTCLWVYLSVVFVAIAVCGN